MNTQQAANTNIDTVPGYWNSILISTLGVGLVSSIIPAIFGYVTIGMEPSCSLFQMFTPVIGFCFACLFGELGGLISVWHYTRTYDVLVELGKGALIGFFTGVAILIFSTLFEQLWYLIDTDFIENLRTSLIAIIDATELPTGQKEQQIDMIASQYASDGGFISVLISIGTGGVIYGLLNLLSGMLGVKFFAKKEEF
jgi:hypothetical protein